MRTNNTSIQKNYFDALFFTNVTSTEKLPFNISPAEFKLMIIETKKCSSCQFDKSFDEMIKSKVNKNGIGSYCKDCMKIKSINFREKNPIQQMLSNCKSSAKRRNIVFDLQLEDLVIPTYCKYLGIQLEFNVGNGLLPQTPSIDRIDTNKGYTKDNIQIISHKANALKSDLNIDTLIYFANQILLIHN